MTETNYILLNMMKHQLLAIYQTYGDFSDLLNDPAIKRGYETLVSVKNADELHEWQKYIAVLGLNFANPNGIERRQNILGELDDLISKANESTIDEFIEWKISFTPSEWADIENHYCELVKKIHALADRNYDVHIMLVLCGTQCVAMGNDADRLFEIFGWQTSTAFDGEKHISFMFINKYGLIVLAESGYSVTTVDLADTDDKDEAFFSDSFTEDMVAEFQQRIDYMRLIGRNMNEFKSFMDNSQSFVAPKLGYNALVGSQISFNAGSVTAVLDDGSEITIAEGNSWRLDDLGLPYMLSLGAKLGEA